MYERTFVSGEAKELAARPIEGHASVRSVGIYRRGECIAVKEFDIVNGLIVLQSMKSDLSS